MLVYFEIPAVLFQQLEAFGIGTLEKLGMDLELKGVEGAVGVLPQTLSPTIYFFNKTVAIENQSRVKN